jgi:hypothetical protein
MCTRIPLRAVASVMTGWCIHAARCFKRGQQFQHVRCDRDIWGGTRDDRANEMNGGEQSADIAFKAQAASTKCPAFA